MDEQQGNAVQRENQIKKAKLCRAYVKVLGTDDKRTPEQKLVWADMEDRAGIWKHDIIISNSGHIDPIRMNILGGQRLFFINIVNLLRDGLKLNTDKEKKTVKVIKE